MPLETGELLRILACPACKVVYPVREDIPIMLDEEAKDRPTWDAGHPQAVERG